MVLKGDPLFWGNAFSLVKHSASQRSTFCFSWKNLETCLREVCFWGGNKFLCFFYVFLQKNLKTCLCEVFGFCFVWPGLVWPRPASPAPARPSPSLASPDRPSPGLPRPSWEQPSRTLAAPVLRFRYAGQGWSGRAQKIGFQVSIMFFIKQTWKPSPETKFSCFSSVFPK